MRDVGDATRQPGAPHASSRRSVFFGAMVWLIWLLYMVPVTASLFASHPSPLRLIGSLTGAAVFVAMYVWMAWQNAQKVVGATPQRSEESLLSLWLPVVVMLVLSAVLIEVNGVAWGALFIYTCAGAAGRLPPRHAAGLLVAVIAFALVYGWRTHLPTSTTVANLFTIAFAGTTTITMVFAVTTSRRWREEREELARFASVADERLRIARDLHDLLGHSLSLIALKSDLAQQLIPLAPERAAAEVADIERTAREALHEVRETVAGYRRPTLAAELLEARNMLAAAGIAYDARIDERVIEMLPRVAEAALSWAVREGATNVMRHGHARRCELRLETHDGEILLEIDDDGIGVGEQDRDAAPVARAGNGLRGLGERVKAAGGRYTAGPRPTGGFSLRVWMPLAGDRPQTTPAGAARDAGSAVAPEAEDATAAKDAPGANAGVLATTEQRGDTA